MVERFGWRADTDSLPYMVEFAGTPAAYREQVFGRIEAFQARFPEWFKDGSAFS